MSTEEIHSNLKIDHYNIHLPGSWVKYGQARIILFVHDSLSVNFKNYGLQYSDLPIITCEIGIGRERKTIVNFFYREFTGGVSGLSDIASQYNRLTRIINVWKMITDSDKDILCIGDVNLCGVKWCQDDYHSKDLADMVQTHLLKTNCYQIINEYQI